MATEPENGRASWTRRLFVKDSFLGWLGLVVGPAAYSLLRRYDSVSVARGELSKELGTISDFSAGKAKEVTLGGKKVLVARVDSGDWIAVSAVCTHMGCSVRLHGDGNENVVACNCHNSRFGIDGTNISGPAPSPLAKYDIFIMGEKVVLSAPKARKDELP